MDTIGEFLVENDMTVYLVIFDRKAYQISAALFADIAEYIDDRYVDEHTDLMRGSVKILSSSDSRKQTGQPHSESE